MTLRYTEFDNTLIQDAVTLLKKEHQKALNQLDFQILLPDDQYHRIIETELKKEISSTHMVFDQDRLVGFAIATITRDSNWGDSGWINMGGWAVEDEYTQILESLYQRVAEMWIKSGIKRHHFLVYAFHKDQLERFFELGFGKEQAYAIYDLKNHSGDTEKDSPHPYTSRHAQTTDQSQLSGFSRLIAEHQTQSPCFASAPETYLKELDKGFSELTADPEADIYVIENEEKIIGYQVFYKSENPHLIIPENSVELAVSGITHEYQGKGAGYCLTDYALIKQKTLGFDYAVTDWRCANLLSGKFWQKTGFKPVVFRLVRRIDPLI